MRGAGPGGLRDLGTWNAVGATRLDAAKERSPLVSATIGVREWLEGLTVPAGLRCAAFDTKVVSPRLPGSAAKAIDKRLRAAGAVRACEPKTFFVHGKADGLAEGELDAARAWARALPVSAAPATA